MSTVSMRAILGVFVKNDWFHTVKMHDLKKMALELAGNLENAPADDWYQEVAVTLSEEGFFDNYDVVSFKEVVQAVLKSVGDQNQFFDTKTIEESKKPGRIVEGAQVDRTPDPVVIPAPPPPPAPPSGQYPAPPPAQYSMKPPEQDDIPFPPLPANSPPVQQPEVSDHPFDEPPLPPPPGVEAMGG